MPAAQASIFANQDQLGYEAWQQHDYAQAQTKFKNPDWRGAARYQLGDFQGALAEWEHSNAPERDYNRGNALAKLGQYQAAIKAYDDALAKDPNNQDATYNRELVKKLLDQKQQQDKQQQDKQQQDKQQQDKQQQDKQQQDKQQQDKQQQDKQQQDKQQQDKQQQNKQQQDKKNTDSKNATSTDENKENNSPEAQWLRRIPDDPGELLRRKFLLERSRREHQTQYSR